MWVKPKIKNRVSSYFINSNQHSRKTMRLVKQIIDFDVLHTDTELMRPSRMSTDSTVSAALQSPNECL